MSQGGDRPCAHHRVPAGEETVTQLKAGELLYVTRAASVQFVSPIFFRLIRVLDWITYDGWIWPDGYQLDQRARL